MAVNTRQIVDILRDYDIIPEDALEAALGLPAEEAVFRDIGEIAEGETVYATSIGQVLGEGGEGPSETSSRGDERIQRWMDQLAPTIEVMRAQAARDATRRLDVRDREPHEPHCAWYCPVHFFGHGWGIFIRENCILSLTLDIVPFVDWSAVRGSAESIAHQLLRSGFYAVFLHEQFHHKVESAGFRFLVSAGADRYRPYKARVYRPSYLTPDCLEESLANAESYRRLGEPRYVERVERPIRDGLRRYLKATIPRQPPGYAEGVHYLSDRAYRDGLYLLQSQIFDGELAPKKPASHWAIAPNLITALTDITDDIYVILPNGASPIFKPTTVDPGYTVSSQALEVALRKYHGYRVVPGGKGSHVKLAKQGARTIVLPGNRLVLSPGVVKHALDAVGGYPLSKLGDLLDGTLASSTADKR